MVIEVYATGICGTDLHIQDDEFPSIPPVVMGHEVTGRVVEAGAGAEDWLGVARVARDVLLHLRPLCRLPGGPAQPVPHASLHRLATSTAGSPRYVLVPQRNLHAVHASVGEHAGALYEPLSCVAQCLCDPAVASPR